VWLTVAIVSLCADSATAGLIALACGGTVYLAGSIYAVRSWRTAMWAWPLAVVLSVAVAISVLAVATGGPHACTT
jgi:membrane protein implicated in regulation of membrane protease activity